MHPLTAGARYPKVTGKIVNVGENNSIAQQSLGAEKGVGKEHMLKQSHGWLFRMGY